MSAELQRLSDVVRASRIKMPLVASTLVDAASVLAACLDTDGALSSAELLIERIEDARPEDIVGLGDRAFLMHYRTDAVRDLAVAIGIAAHPLCRELADDEAQCARIVVLLCTPPRQMGRHLQVLGAFARTLAKPIIVNAMLAAANADAVVRLQEFRDVELPVQLTVRDLMSERPRTVGAEAPLRSAVLEMLRAGVGGLPVVDETNRVIGMLSERELLRDLLSHYLPRAGAAIAVPPPSASRRTVRDIMTRQVLCVSPEQPLAEVASLMLNKDVERVPVVKEGVLVGFLTRGDIVRKLIGS